MDSHGAANGLEMSWKDTEAAVLQRLEARLSPENWKWLRGAVNWEAGDLDEASTTEVRLWFNRPSNKNGINDTGLCRTWIWQSWIKIQAGVVDPVNGNLRSYWYQTVEPFYNTHSLWPEEEPQRGGDTFEDHLYEQVLGFIGDFVRHRVFLYRPEWQFQLPSDSRYIIGRDRAKFIFYTEKEGLWESHCVPMAEGGEDQLELKITAFSTKGQPPFVAVEHLANELMNLPYPVANPVILACSDFDPWGLRIAEQIDAKMRFFGFKSVTTYRLITLDLFTPKNLKGAKDLSKMTASRTDIQHWLDVTGGVHGEAKGIHCDVVNRSRREQLFKDIRLGIRRGDLADRFPLVKPVPMEQLSPADEPIGRLYT